MPFVTAPLWHARGRPHHRSSTPRCTATGGGQPEAQTPPPEDGKPKPVLQPPPVRPTDAGAGDAPEAPAHLRSGMYSAMQQYFGDDGREVDSFCKRPTTDDGRPMYRVLVLGSGVRELALVRALEACPTVNGLYYAPNEEGVCALGWPPLATSTGHAAADADGALRFARWALVDAIFVGPDHAGAMPPDVEKELAAAAVTVFPHDVSAAVADGALDPADCLAPLGDNLDTPNTNDGAVYQPEFSLPEV